MSRFLPQALLAFLLWTMFPIVHGAPIAWQTPFNISDVSDISTNGTLIEAKNATNNNASPTVSVDGEMITFEDMEFGIGAAAGNFYTGDGGDSGNADLNTVLNSHVWTGNDWDFALTGLTAGTAYQIQLIGGGDTRGCCSSRNQRAGDDESPENISNDYSRSGVGSVIGTFTADGTSQTIRILRGNDNGVDPSMSGYILRETSPATPEAPTSLTLSNTDLAPSTPAGTLIGTLTTVDPNADDMHTYSLVSPDTFTGNAHFQIINGNELRSTGALGSFGTKYTIRLRTTDQETLSLESTFILEVETAEAPTALNLSSSTLLQNTPLGIAVGQFSTIDGNTADRHTYALVPGNGDTDNALFAINEDTLQVADTIPGLDAALSLRVRSTDLSNASIEQVFSLVVVGSSIRINEFLADNTSTTIMDEDGTTPDWIELHNPDGGSVNLDGWHLTDDPTNLTKWQFPAVSIVGNGYLLVFASSKDRRPTNGAPLHTNFSLNAGGDYLALVATDGTTILSEFGSAEADYPKQKPGNSYGFFGDGLQIGFILEPTPETSNNEADGVLGFVADTDFSVSRGFYDAPFALTITSATPGASIRYTTNGDWPSETSGNLYNGPIEVNRTMPVKAIAYRSGYVSTNIDTHTYILVDSVVAQTAANTRSTYGLPSSWDGQSPYYGMNGNANVNPATHPTIKNDLMTVPSLSIAIDVDDMFGSSGIYSNPGASGAAWERKTSLEMIDPSGSEVFQQNCAIRIQGGAFRSFGLTRKKSFRVLFKSQFGTSNQPTDGPGKLSFPMFGDEPGVAQEFQTLTFRMESNDGWQWSSAGDQPQYARDEFGRRAQLALGQPAAHGRFLHIYINGVYWGVYNVVERPDAGFAESYIEGANRDLWEGQNSGSAINSARNLITWNTYNTVVSRIGSASNDTLRDSRYLEACGFASNGTRNSTLPIWCDPNNNIDYFLVNWYAGNSDWPFKNYYGGIDTQTTRTGYKYFMWDAEWSLLLRSNLNTNKVSDFRGIASPNDDLEESPEFRLRFADRAHRALFNGGPLSPEGSQALYDEVTTQHRSILVPEAARWGDQHGQDRDVTDWEAEYNEIINDWFPARTGNFLNQLRARGLYPDIGAPAYSQHGGSVPRGSGPALMVPDTVSRVYYRFGNEDTDLTDYEHSLDPRLVGGAIHPDAVRIDLNGGGGRGPVRTRYLRSGATWKYLDDGSDQGILWRARNFDDAAWKSGQSQLGYGDGDEATEIDFIDANPNQGGIQKNATTYFRTTVSIPDPSVFDHFAVDYTYDDAIAIYVNGVEIARRGLPSNAAFDDYADDGDGDNATRTAMVPPSRFLAGMNTITAEVHQLNATSSDLSFDLELTGNPTGGGGNTVSTDPLVLTDPGWLFSRSYDPGTGEWSALNTAYFSINTVPADASNLVISELHYHPAEPSTPEEQAISSNRDNYEFIELLNVGTQTIDLTGLRFTEGIDFSFADNTLLAPGARLVLVRHRSAFEARYAASLAEITMATDILGNTEYSGRLDNDGEQILLLDAQGAVIQDFTYNDQLPWPTSADGHGASLLLVNLGIPIPDHTVETNWQASEGVGGTPGQPDGDIVVEAFTITAAPDFAGGSIQISPSQDTYIRGTSVTFTPIAQPGFNFVSWSGSLSGNDIALTIQITSDLEIGALFEQDKTYTITIPQDLDGGSIQVSPIQPTYTEGTSVTFTPIAEPGFNFASWSGSLSGNDVPLTIQITDNLDISALFKPDATFTITIPQDLNGGSIQVSPEQPNYAEGVTVTFTPIAEPGFSFVSWGGSLDGTAVPFTVQITSNLQPSALFERDLTAFEQWQANQFTDPAFAFPTDDPDDDGVANLIEYAQGTDPLAKTSQAASLISKASDNQIELIVPFTTDDPDITWILEQSSNLINWTVLTPQDTIQTETELRLRIDRPASQVYLRIRLTLSVSP
ncbi:MAG: lamin tail domain-containing protein [Verrucomicrobiales bacterium]|nr:lamin tail domain-containing protein [Verrucomicrobiales bacterium]